MIATLLATLLCGQIPPSGRIDRARVCMAALDYGCAETELSAARQALAALPLDQKRTVPRLSAETALAANREPDARAHLQQLLKADPRFRPSATEWPAPWRSLLEELRAALPDTEPPRLEVRLPVVASAGEPVTITVIATDKSGVGGVTLFVGDMRAPMTTTDGRHWTATIVAGHVRAPELLLWVEAVDQQGNGPARWGSAEAPKTLAVDAPPQEESVATRWWFWTTIGGVALLGAAAGVTAWALTRDEPGPVPPSQPLETGSVHMRFPPWFRASD